MLSCEKRLRLASAMTSRLKRYRAAAIFAMLAAGTSANPARAADIVLKDAASMAGAVMWLNSGAPGLVLAAGRGEETIVLGYGETRPGSKGDPHGRSLLRTGAIAKGKAGPVLSSMAAGATPHLPHPLPPNSPP